MVGLELNSRGGFVCSVALSGLVDCEQSVIQIRLADKGIFVGQVERAHRFATKGCVRIN